MHKPLQHTRSHRRWLFPRTLVVIGIMVALLIVGGVTFTVTASHPVPAHADGIFSNGSGSISTGYYAPPFYNVGGRVGR
jgi:hypothetical protein